MNLPPRLRTARTFGTVSLAAFAACLSPVFTSAARPPVVTAASIAPIPDVPNSLDLPTALRFALDHNFDILQARERIREQEGLIIEIKSLALPNASIGSVYSLTDGALSADSNGPAKSQSQYWKIALEVRQTLYSGGGVSAALDAQKYSRESALLDLQSTINAALLDVRIRFYDVLLAREQIKVQDANVQLLREQLQTAKNRFDAGAVSNFEVLRAEVALANAQPGLIRARNGFRTSIDTLRQSLGYANPRAESTRKLPEFVGALEYQPAHYELEDSLASARANRPELQRLAKVELARDAAVRNAKSGYRPDVALVGGYQFRKDGRSDRFQESLDGWSVGLQSNWAIFDGRATAGRVAQARSRLNQSKLQTSEATLAVEVEVRRALSSLQEAGELAEAAKKVVAQAEEALRLADARYAAATATQLDVLEARVALTEARNNQLQANYSHTVALAVVRKAIGQADPFALKP